MVGMLAILILHFVTYESSYSMNSPLEAALPSYRVYQPPFYQKLKLGFIFWFTYSMQMFVLWPFMILLFCIKRYSFTDIFKVREEFFRTIEVPERPYILCTNHLTWIDPFLIAWVVAPPWRAVFRPSIFPWGITGARYSKNWFFKIIFVMTRTIIVAASQAINQNSWKFLSSSYVLNLGHPILIFPEGTRSENGMVNVNNPTSGAGFLIKTVPKAQIICAYLRPDTAKTKVNFPKAKSKIHFNFKLIEIPEKTIQELSSKEITKKVLDNIADLEKDYQQKYGR